MWVFPPCCQIFMCLLWMLLQFVVLAMYWDVPPVSCEGGATMMEMKQEEVEEEVPLMGSDEEPVHTYRALNSDQLETSTSSDMQPVHRASDPSETSAPAEVSRQVWLPVSSNYSQLSSAPFCSVQVGRGVTANAHVSYLLYWFCLYLLTQSRTHFPFSRSLWGIFCSMSDQIPGVLIGLACTCLVYVRACIYMMSGALLD